MIARAAGRNMRIAEAPVASRRAADPARSSHLRPWRDGWRHLRLLLMLCPRWLFLRPGLALLAAGLAVAAAPALFPAEKGGPLGGYTMLFGSAGTICGAQLIGLHYLAQAYCESAGLVEGRLLALLRGRRVVETGVSCGLALVLAGAAGTVWSLARMGRRKRAGAPAAHLHRRGHRVRPGRAGDILRLSAVAVRDPGGAPMSRTFGLSRGAISGVARSSAFLAAAGAAGAALVLLRGAGYGVALDVDSAAYVSTARRLLEGAGFLKWDDVPYVDSPPLLPLALALPGLFGLDAAAAARYVNAAAFGATAAAAGVWLRARLRSDGILLWAVCACALSPPLARAAAGADTEPLFVLFVVLSLFAWIDTWTTGGRGCWRRRRRAPRWPA